MADDETEAQESDTPPQPPPMQETVSDSEVDTLSDEPTRAGAPPSEADIESRTTTVVVYVDGEAVDRQTFHGASIVFGAGDDQEADRLDLSAWNDDDALWAEHGVIYAHGDDRTLVVTSDSKTQRNGELLELGTSRSLQDGDRIIVAGDIGLVVQF